MIHSMTGYGRHELNLKQANFTIEVKSLNSKQLDTSVKISSVYRDKEITLRKLLSQKLQRGKIELSVWKERHASSFKYSLNTILIKDYFNQIQQLKKELGINGNTLTMNSFEADLIPSLLKMPEVMQKGEDKADENEWKEIIHGIHIAIDTHPQARFIFTNPPAVYVIPPDGHAWWVDTTKEHSAMNGSLKPRIHFVACLDNTDPD